MNQEEFFEKLRSGKFPGEMTGVDEIANYVKYPKGNKIYNNSSKNYVNGIVDIIMEKSEGRFEVEVFENKERGIYQIGVFCKNSKPFEGTKSPNEYDSEQ